MKSSMRIKLIVRVIVLLWIFFLFREGLIRDF